jgi:hypothetical protein
MCFEQFVLPTTKKLGKPITDSITHDLATGYIKLRLKQLVKAKGALKNAYTF